MGGGWNDRCLCKHPARKYSGLDNFLHTCMSNYGQVLTCIKPDSKRLLLKLNPPQPTPKHTHLVHSITLVLPGYIHTWVVGWPGWLRSCYTLDHIRVFHCHILTWNSCLERWRVAVGVNAHIFVVIFFYQSAAFIATTYPSTWYQCIYWIPCRIELHYLEAEHAWKHSFPPKLCSSVTS